MKGSSLFIIAGFFLVFVTLRSEEAPPLIAYKKAETKFRSIATGDSRKCFRDLFTVENLKREVQELEAARDTNRISGNWNHLDLATLPTPAAEFLLKFGIQLGDGTQDRGSCDNVPCLFNQVYGTPDGIAGYVHYIWFLRTGVYLAADNMVPNQVSPTPGSYNGISHPLSAYLFEKDELYAFWRLSRMMVVPHSNLTYLKEIQRVPKGQNMEGAASTTCGLAYSQGWINLNDGCLISYPQSDSGYVYSSVIHELTHQLDFEDGKRFNAGIYRSHREDYLALTGFELLEYQNSSGETVRQWNLKPDARVVSAYGSGSPQESFAELLAYFRTEGDNTKTKVSAETFELARGYYEGKSFEHEEIQKRWLKKASLSSAKDLLQNLLNCNDSECESLTLDLMVDDELGKIRSQDPDGCSVLSNPLIGQTFPQKLKTAMEEVSDTFQSGRQMRQVILENFDVIMNPLVSYESFFACHDSGSVCYENKILEKKASELESYGESAEVLLSVYKEVFPFQNVHDEVTGFYHSLLASREGIMKRKADELWESCKQIPLSDSQPPIGNEYVVREGYMVSSVYNCLNRGFMSGLHASLDAIKLQEFSPRNPEERAFILSLMRPVFVRIFDDQLRSGRGSERRNRDAFVAQYSKWVYDTMRSNRYWMPRGRPDQLTIEAACKDAAVKLIGNPVYFHLKKELFKDLLEKSCKDIR